MMNLDDFDNPLRLAIITYDHAHLKTEQLVDRFLLANRLSDKPRFDLKLLALPFSARPSRKVLFSHRPDQDKSVATKELASRYGLDFAPCSYDSVPDIADYYIVAGAGIFSSSAIGTKKILNAHPGIIPSARGLDAFKWSIRDNVQLGITLHYIDAEVDAGETVAIVETPIFLSDSIEILARRHYELELDVLTNFLSFLNRKSTFEPVSYPDNPPHMRMPITLEEEMIAKFDAYKAKFSSLPRT